MVGIVTCLLHVQSTNTGLDMLLVIFVTKEVMISVLDGDNLKLPDNR